MDDSGYIASESYGSRLQKSSTVFPGKLKKVILKNFMCHDHFEIEFNSCINFIHGRNGSGKSAIATALVLGLGQRATATCRGVSAKSFIKRGRRIAIIEITLWNCGAGNTYKSDHFGNQITIIRKITENSGSQYKLRSETGQEENLSRRDLDSILLHFKIQPNNPLCILSQDTARSFFKSRDPKQMYQLFMEGTQMEIVNENNKKNIQHVKQLKKECERDEMELKKIYQDVIEADKKQEIANKLKVAEEKKTYLEKELAWSNVNLWKEKVNENTDCLSLATRDKEEYEKNEFDKRESQKSLLDDKTVLENNLDVFQRGLEDLDVELRKNTENIHRDHEQLKSKRQTLEKEKLKISSLNDDINQLKNAINEIQSKHSQSQVYKQKLVQVTEKIQETEATIKTTETHCGQLNDTFVERSEQLENINCALKANDFKCRDLELKLTQLKEGNSLGVYGHWMPKLVEKIKYAHAQGMFRQQPRGPLGSYIQVNNKGWVPSIESFLRSVLSMFCVSCKEDYKVLNNLIDQVIDKNRSDRAPGIVVCKFSFNVHDYRRYEVKTNKYHSLISNLKISDPVVANCLIDQQAIEQILLVPGVDEAARLMEMEQNVPSNCRFILTQQADLVYPAPNYRIYSGYVKRGCLLQADVSQEIREIEHKLELLKNDRVNDQTSKINLLKEIRQIQLDIQQCNSELKKLAEKKKCFVATKFELEKNAVFEPQSIEMYKDEIKECTSKKEITLKEIENIEKDIESLDKNISEYYKKKNELLIKQKDFNIKINSHKDKIQNIEKHLREWRKRNDECERKLEEKTEKIIQCKKKLEDSERKYNHFLEIVEKEKIIKTDVVRNSEEIKRDLNQIDTAIKVFIQELGGSKEQADKDHYYKKRMYQNKKDSIARLQDCIKKSEKRLEADLASYRKTKNQQTRIAEVTFKNLLKIRNLEGRLKFDFDEKKLHINVIPKGKGSLNEQTSTLNSLSGGERSYATTAFIRAIWNSMTSPFYVLDEFDVFTDLSNRTQIIQLLIDHAKDNMHCQYLLITPLDLSHIVTNDLITIHVIRNPRDEQQ